MPSSDGALLEASDLHRAYGAATVLRGMDVRLAAGESLADLRAATYDVQGLAERDVAMEALDQLAMEHLLGAR